MDTKDRMDGCVCANGAKVAEIVHPYCPAHVTPEMEEATEATRRDLAGWMATSDKPWAENAALRAEVETLRNQTPRKETVEMVCALNAAVAERDAKIARLEAAMPTNDEHRLFVRAVDSMGMTSAEYDAAWAALRRLIEACDSRDLDAEALGVRS